MTVLLNCQERWLGPSFSCVSARSNSPPTEPSAGRLARRKSASRAHHVDSTKEAKRHVRIVVDQITNFPVLSEGPDAPLLTSRHVREILSEFP